MSQLRNLKYFPSLSYSEMPYRRQRMLQAILERILLPSANEDERSAMKRELADLESDRQASVHQMAVQTARGRVTPALPLSQHRLRRQDMERSPHPTSSTAQRSSDIAVAATAATVAYNSSTVEPPDSVETRQCESQTHTTQNLTNVQQTQEEIEKLGDAAIPTHREMLLHENQSLRKKLQKLQDDDATLRQYYGNELKRLSMKSEEMRNIIAMERKAKQLAQAKLHEKGEQNEKLQNSLEDCKAHIFQNNPTAKTHDKQILEHYRQFCECIGDWVHHNFGDSENLYDRILGLNLDPETKNTMHLYFHPTRYGRVLNGYVTAALPMHMWVVFHHFALYILSAEDEFTGYGKTLKEVIDMLEHLKVKSGASRDQMKAWKADLHTAVLSSEMYEQKYLTYLLDVSNCIYPYFEELIPGDRRQANSFDSFHKLTQEGAGFNRLRNLSLTSYRLQCDVFPHEPIESRILHQRSVSRYKYIDAKTGQDIRGPSSLRAGNDGRIGVMLCVIFPALMREKTENSEEMELEKATVLLDPDFPLIRSKRTRTDSVAARHGTEKDMMEFKE